MYDIILSVQNCKRFQTALSELIEMPRIQSAPSKGFWITWFFLLPMRIKPTQNIFLTVSFFLSIFIFPAFANNLINDIQIQSQLGSIKESYEAPNQSQKSPLIIQIQDAHCNYEAQKNLSQILDYLAREKKLQLVMVEGGSGDVSLSFLRSFTDVKSREEIADRYLRAGKISGEEYLDIISDYKLDLYGIEDPGLYDSNLDSFLNIDGYKDQGISDIANLRVVVEALKPLMLNEQLMRFEEKLAGSDSQKLSLSEKCSYLRGAAVEKGVNIDSYSHIAAFLESAEIEKKIDFKQAEQQRAAFIKSLAQKLDDASVKQLINQTQSFKDKKLSPDEFYKFLQDKAKDKIDLKKDYPQFEVYMRYISAGRKIDAEALSKELLDLEQAVRESLFANNNERRLVEISKKLDILERFLRLDLTPAEYESMLSDKSDFLTASWVNFLSDNCRNYKLALRPKVSSIIDDNFDKIDSFYKVGMDREQAFLKNIKKKMSENKNDAVVAVITGGFHTTGMSKLFQKEGFSYVVVTPAITKKSDPEVYFSVLRQDKEPLPEYSGSDTE